MKNPQYTHEITVRFFDLDANNHVNNSVYLTYMEEARTKWLMEQYLFCKENGINFVAAEAHVKYKHAIGLNDKVLVQMSMQNIKGISFEVLYTFTNGNGLIYAEGSTRMACIDANTGKLVRLPEDLMAFCLKGMGDQ